MAGKWGLYSGFTVLAFLAGGPACAQSTPAGVTPVPQHPVEAAPSGVAGAGSATPEGARQLTTVFGRYFGQDAVGPQGSISITPDGQSYKLVIDPARLKPPASAAAVPFSITGGAYAANLMPQSDGKWRVTSEGPPMMTMTAADQTTTFGYDGFHFDGIFDPKLGTFTSGTTVSTGMTMSAVSPKASMATKTSGRTEAKITSTDTGGGTVATTIAQTITDFGYTMSMTAPAAAPDATATAIALEAHAAKANGEATVANIRPARLLDLWAFLVAHPSKPQLAASQAEFKGLLLALLPLGSMSASADIDGLNVVTPEGAVGFGTLSERLEVGGAAGPDGFRLAFSAAGLALPPGLVPGWADGLTPTGVSLDATVGPVHVDEALLKLIAAFDLAADDPLTDQQGAAVTAALGSPEAILVKLGPSTITTPLLSLKVEGASHYDLATASPAITASVEATGLDKAIDAMADRAKMAPEAASVLQIMVAMKQLAKAGPDGSYLWAIEMAPGGAVTVNGKPIDQGKKARKLRKTELTSP